MAVIYAKCVVRAYVDIDKLSIGTHSIGICIAALLSQETVSHGAILQGYGSGNVDVTKYECHICRGRESRIPPTLCQHLAVRPPNLRSWSEHCES